MTMTGKAFGSDPCPEIPEHFVDPIRILKLARQVKGVVAVTEGKRPGSAAEDDPNPTAGFTPRPRLRTTVATRGDARRFGPILA